MALEARDFLARHRLSDFPQPDEVITLSDTDTMLAAMERLVKADVLCAPVRNSSPASDSVEDSFIGVANMAQLAHTLLEHLGGKSSHKNGLEHLMGLKQIQNAKLGELQDMSGLNRTILAMSPETTLLDACKQLGTMNVHRISVLDGNKLVNFITQSAVVRTLASNLEHLPETAHKTLRDAHLTQPSTLVFAKREMTALAAFKLMKDKEVSALPILDDAGHIIGNISVRDLRGVITNPRLFAALHSPVTEFLTANVTDAVRSEMFPYITCTADATLADVLSKLASSRIHRVYVVDAKNVPIRVISLSDVLAALVVPDAS